MDGPFSRPTCRVVFRTLLAAHAGRGGGQVRPHGGARRRPCPGECSMTARRWGAGMIVACVPVPRSAIPGNDYLGIIRVLPIPPCGCRLSLRCRCHTAPCGLAIPIHVPIAAAGSECREATEREWPRHRGTGPRGRARRSDPPRVGPTGAGHAVPVGRGGRPGNAATGDAYRLMSYDAYRCARPRDDIRYVDIVSAVGEYPIANIVVVSNRSLRNHYYTEIT